MQKHTHRKEANIVEATGIFLTLLFVIFMATFLNMFFSILTGQTYQTSETIISQIGNFSNTDSFTGNNVTAQNLTQRPIHTGSLVIRNSTGSVVGISNFTVDYTLGSILANAANNGKTLTGTYNYGNLTIQNSIYSMAQYGFQAQSQTASYSPLMALIFVMAIMLTILISSIGGFGGFGSIGASRGSVVL